MRIQTKLLRAESLVAKHSLENRILQAENNNLKAARERDKKTIEGLVENLEKLRKSSNELSDKNEALQKALDHQNNTITGFEGVSGALCRSIALLIAGKESK